MSDSSEGVLRRGFLKTTGAAAGAVAASGMVSATPGREPGPKTDEVVVGVSAAADNMRGTVAESVPGNAEVVHQNDTLRYVAVKFPSQAADVAKENFIEAVTSKRNVKYAERNATYEALETVNDPKEPDQWWLGAINARAAWDTTFGSSDVRLAIVDTGVEYTHPDLDGNFRSDPGWDFVDDDDDPAPDDPSEEYHGTQVAGIAGAETDNGECIAGVSQSELINGRVLGAGGSGSLTDIVDGIQWAADQNADVLNLSLGGVGYQETMKNAVSYANDNGVTIVCAAGNDSASSVGYPAAYSECIAVSAVDRNGNLPSFTNTGDEVEVAAPGVDYLSTTTQVRGGCGDFFSGTSAASSCAAGVVALLVDQWGTDNTNTRAHLKATARDTSLSDTEEGAGIVDAQAAVETEPDSGGGGGSDTTTGSISDSLSGYTDSDCWTWSWNYSSPSKVVLELDGPSDADFDLYANDGEATCPDYYDNDYQSVTLDSQESITINSPDTSTDLYMAVDSYSGNGDYTLTVTEYE
jgi:serine protease